jgi:hypothetical protein
MSSLQVPLIKYFPSGQTHVPPEGFSKQRNSHSKSKQGLGTDENKIKENKAIRIVTINFETIKFINVK